MLKRISVSLVLISAVACGSDKAAQGTQKEVATQKTTTPPNEDNKVAVPAPATTPTPAIAPEPANLKPIKQEPVVRAIPASTPVSPSTAPTTAPAPPRLPGVQPIIGESVDFPDSEVALRNGASFIPIIKTAGYTIWATSWVDWTRDSTRIPVVKVMKGDDLSRESARMDVRYMAGEHETHYNKHIVRRGVELRDGSLLIFASNRSNFAPSYTYTYVFKTDANLVGVSSFGKDGVVALETTSTKFNYRFVRKITEAANGDLFLFEKRSVREGEPDYGSTPDRCFKIKYSKHGKLDTKFGKMGFEDLPSCQGL